MSRRFVITFGCPDRIGIVARIATFLADLGGLIVEAAYHTDQDTGWFFTRQEIDASTLGVGIDELRARFGEIAEELADERDWNIMDTDERRRVVILVSKEGHCLYDILGRVASGELDVDVTAVIGNHADLAAITEAHGIPFHHVPFPVDDKPAAFARLRERINAVATIAGQNRIEADDVATRAVQAAEGLTDLERATRDLEQVATMLRDLTRGFAHRRMTYSHECVSPDRAFPRSNPASCKDCDDRSRQEATSR